MNDYLAEWRAASLASISRTRRSLLSILAWVIVRYEHGGSTYVNLPLGCLFSAFVALMLSILVLSIFGFGFLFPFGSDGITYGAVTYRCCAARSCVRRNW